MKTMTPSTDDTRHSGRMPSCEAAVECLSVDCGQMPAVVEVSRFSGAGGVMECHISVRLTGADSMAPAECLERAYQKAMDFLGIGAASAVFRRIFCSDVSNQAQVLDEILSRFKGDCATSIIGQAPLPAAKFSLWAYHIMDPVAPLWKERDVGTLGVRRGPLTHFWSCGLVDGHEPGSHSQTRQVIESYDAWLQSRGMTMADHVVRTWWFVQNIDADYQGLVEARREFFQTHGLARYDGRMPYRRCGDSGLLLPAISLGFWHNFGAVDDFEEARRMMRRAFDRGVTHFDSPTTTARHPARPRKSPGASWSATSSAIATNW
jgi:hypothetical protein